MEPFVNEWPEGIIGAPPEHNDRFLEKIKQAISVDPRDEPYSAQDDFDLFLEEPDSYVYEKVQRYMSSVTIGGAGQFGELLDLPVAWMASSSPGVGSESLRSPRCALPAGYISTSGELATVQKLRKHMASARHAPLEVQATINRIFIQNLHQSFTLLLAQTVSSIYHPHLKVAITKHIAFDSSIRVEIPRSFRCFRLELHLPYFTLQESAQCAASRILGGPRRRSHDISFLGKIPNRAGEVFTSITQTHLAFTVCGTSNRTWNAYCFQDEHKDLNKLKDLVSNGLGFDPFADEKRQASDTFLNPRQFWATTANILVSKVHQEWHELVCLIELAIERRNEEQHGRHRLCQHVTRGQQHKEHLSMFDWTQSMIELLHLLIDSMERTLKCWKSFNEEGGGIGYFSDVRDPYEDSARSTRTAIGHMRATMQRIERRKDSLEQARKNYQNIAIDLQLRLNLRITESTDFNSERSAFTIDIVYPVMAVMAIYAIPPEHTPFELDRKNFLLLTALIIANIVIVQLLFVARRWLPGTSWWEDKWRTASAKIPVFSTSFSSIWTRKEGEAVVSTALGSLSEGDSV